MVLSFAQLRTEWLTAGGAPKEADVAAAVAMAESHGRMSDHNADDPWGGSWCAWQINGAHRGVFNMPGLTHDPYACAMAAVYVRHKQGWNAWSTHYYGQYKAFLPHHGRHVALFSSTHIERHHRAAVAHHGHVRHHSGHARPEPVALEFGLMFALLAIVYFGMHAMKFSLLHWRRQRAIRLRAVRIRERKAELALQRRQRRRMPRATRRAALA